jgi:hypothetical protein
MKLTPWFPAKVKPVRVGVYEIENYSSSKWYRYWDNEHWYSGAATPNGAIAQFNIYRLIATFRTPWRGLAEEPK